MKTWRVWLGAIGFLILSTLIFLALLSAIAHGSTQSARPNTLGAPQTVNNPWTYLLALPVDGQIFEGKYTNIRLAPYGAPDLYDQSILFCGNIAYEFNGKTGVVVVVYRTQGSRLYRGTACHELLSVFEVQER